MRQLVSVVTPETVSYFLDEGDEDSPVVKVAQVLNTGLEVDDVIGLGTNLLGALSLNGHKHRPRAVAAPAPIPTPELPPAPVKRAGGRPPGPQKRPMRFWGFTREAVLADLRAHPGTTYLDATERIANTRDVGAKGAYSATLSAVERELTRQRAGRIKREGFTAPDPNGVGKRMVRLWLVERDPPEPQPQEE